MIAPTRTEDRTMPASAAQIAANQITDQGKAQSRGNALKHGLTGEGIVLPNEDAAEIERRLDRHDAEPARINRSNPAKTASSPSRGASSTRFSAAGDSFDLPFSIGRAR